MLGTHLPRRKEADPSRRPGQRSKLTPWRCIIGKLRKEAFEVYHILPPSQLPWALHLIKCFYSWTSALRTYSAQALTCLRLYCLLLVLLNSKSLGISACLRYEESHWNKHDFEEAVTQANTQTWHSKGFEQAKSPGQYGPILQNIIVRAIMPHQSSIVIFIASVAFGLPLIHLVMNEGLEILGSMWHTFPPDHFPNHLGMGPLWKYYDQYCSIVCQSIEIDWSGPSLLEHMFENEDWRDRICVIVLIKACYMAIR